MATVEELLDDPEKLAQLASEDQDQATDEAGESEAKEPKADEKTDDTTEEHGDVLTRDGKHTIPYGVLEATRAREAKATQALTEAKEQMAALQQEVDRLKSGGKPAEKEEQTDDVLASLTQLSDEIPELAKPLAAIAKRVEALNNQVEELSNQSRVAAERERVDTEAVVNEAVDKNPTLRYFRDENPEMWNRAAEIDAVLRADPANRTLPLADRFDKVVAAVEAIHGKTNLPEKYRSKETNQQNAKERAEAKAREAAEQPFTLSDLPGGASPATSDMPIEQMSAADIDRAVSRILERGGDIQDVVSTFQFSSR